MRARRRPSALAPFLVRSFRFQWPADLLTSWAFEMETLILGWFVLVHTGSVLLLTTFASLQFLGTLAAPMFGVLGDRLGGRMLLCAMRAGYAVLAAVLSFFALGNLLTPTAVFIIAALGGIVRPNDQVMRNALIGETIPKEHLMVALGMSRVTMDSARVAGALAGASLSSALGIGPAYLVVTTFYVVSLALTLGVARVQPVPDPSGGWRRGSRGSMAVPTPRASSWRELRDGLAHVWTTPTLLAGTGLALLVNLSAYPTTGGLLPYVVRNVYRADANGLGLLVASFSFGALLGSIAMVVTGGPRYPERSTLINIVLWYAILLGFGHARTMRVGVVALILAGLFQSIAMIAMSATLLRAAGDRFRGRVMGVRTLAVYGLPVGLLGSGALIQRIGFPGAVTALCAIGLVFTSIIALRWRHSLWHA